MLIGLAAVVFGCIALFKFGGKATPAYGDDAAHFMYGSIGAETHSGLPYWMWKTLPSLFPAEFEGRSDYSAFGFLYEKDADGRQLDLPIGISRRAGERHRRRLVQLRNLPRRDLARDAGRFRARRRRHALEQSQPLPLHPLRPRSRRPTSGFRLIT